MEIGAFVDPNQVERLAEAGADFAELIVTGSSLTADDDEFRRQLKEAESWSIPPTSYAGFMPGEIKVCGPNVDVDAQNAYLGMVSKRIRELGGAGATATFGSAASRQIPDGYDRRSAMDQIADFLRRAGELAVKHDIRLSMENQNRFECNVFNTVAECGQFLEEENIENVNLTVDYYHMLVEREPLSVLDEFSSRISHVHLADVGKMPPGTAGAPFDELYASLRRNGYSGTISMEVNWSNFDNEIASAIGFLRSVDPTTQS